MAASCSTCQFWDCPPSAGSIGTCHHIGESRWHSNAEEAWLESDTEFDTDSHVNVALRTSASFLCSEYEPAHAKPLSDDTRQALVQLANIGAGLVALTQKLRVEADG
jgi:hypothetical protein